MEDSYLLKIKNFYTKYKRLPTYTEMLSLFGFASRNAVHWQIKRWIREGVLQKKGQRLSPTSQFFAVPLLGTIPAGSPSIDDYASSDSVSLDEYLVKHPGFTYLLRVSGDSMINEGIREGDLVIIDRKREPKSGDIVAALIDGQWTLKYLKKEKNKAYLSSANPKYLPFYPQNSLTIGGVVVKVIKEYY